MLALIRGSLVGEEEPPDGSTVTVTASARSIEPSRDAAAASVSFGSKIPAGSGTSSRKIHASQRPDFFPHGEVYIDQTPTQ
jgi:hypothetical protein